ncbi:MAG: sterol desaturase family protein [Myxococcota bacterium]
MAPNLILYAVPGFLILIAVELIWARAKGLEYYRFTDSINDLSMGISQQIFDGLKFLLGLGMLTYVYEHHRLTELPASSPWTWIAAFLLFDLCYYWLHRMSHTLNILWAGHAPHHQSEEYNLSVALRQGAFQGTLTLPFYLPLPLLGFPPLVFAVVGQINTIYQFWIHTRLIGRMGFLESFLNTPSHHRVHHGKNPRYLDRNHAGMFIIWDKLFGTFVPEEEEPVYGTVTPLRSWNPLWGQVQYLVHLAHAGWRSPRWSDLIKVWFMPVGWTPQLGQPDVSQIDQTPTFRHKYETSVTTPWRIYVLIQFTLNFAVAVAFLMFKSKLPPAEVLLLAGLIFWNLTSVGALLEGRAWALPVESLRLVVLPLAVYYWLGPPVAAGLAVVHVLSLGSLWAWRTSLQHPAGPLPDPVLQPLTV